MWLVGINSVTELVEARPRAMDGHFVLRDKACSGSRLCRDRCVEAGIGGVEGPFEVDHSIMRGALEEVTHKRRFRSTTTAKTDQSAASSSDSCSTSLSTLSAARDLSDDRERDGCDDKTQPKSEERSQRQGHCQAYLSPQQLRRPIVARRPH